MVRICASKGCAWSLKPCGYPVRYSGQIWVFEFLYLPSSRGCKSIQSVQELLKLKPSYTVQHFFYFILKIGLSKTDSCLEVSYKIASFSARKELSQYRTNLQNKQNKRPFFLPKINKTFQSPFYKIWREGPFWKSLFLKMILSTSRKRCSQAKSSIFSGNWPKMQNGDQNRIYPSLTLRLQNFSL